jgi:hypothetical protein
MGMAYEELWSGLGVPVVQRILGLLSTLLLWCGCREVDDGNGWLFYSLGTRCFCIDFFHRLEMSS